MVNCASGLSSIQAGRTYSLQYTVGLQVTGCCFLRSSSTPPPCSVAMARLRCDVVTPVTTPHRNFPQYLSIAALL